MFRIDQKISDPNNDAQPFFVPNNDAQPNLVPNNDALAKIHRKYYLLKKKVFFTCFTSKKYHRSV